MVGKIGQVLEGVFFCLGVICFITAVLLCLSLAGCAEAPSISDCTLARERALELMDRRREVRCQFDMCRIRRDSTEAWVVPCVGDRFWSCDKHTCEYTPEWQ